MADSTPRYWSKAAALVRGTLPYIGVNAAVYAAFFGVSLLWFGLFAGLAWFFHSALSLPTFAVILVLIGALAFGGVLKWARRYVLYMVKGAHIAAMTELLKGGYPARRQGAV